VTDDLAGILLDLVSSDGIDVSLVNLATMRDSLPSALAVLRTRFTGHSGG